MSVVSALGLIPTFWDIGPNPTFWDMVGLSVSTEQGRDWDLDFFIALLKEFKPHKQTDKH